MRWNPYLAGALVGILAVLSVVVTTLVLDKPKYLGASTTFVRAVGYVEGAVAEEHVAQNTYFTTQKSRPTGRCCLLAAFSLVPSPRRDLAKAASLRPFPRSGKKRFGSSATVRAVGAFLGGVVLMFGARLAGGCPSGHGLSGNMQLAVSGLLALVFFIVGGILMARLVYGKRRSVMEQFIGLITGFCLVSFCRRVKSCALKSRLVLCCSRI